MKKYKFSILLLICVACLLGGCANNGYLKTASTSLDVSTFYSRYYLQNMAVFQNLESNSVALPTETDKADYSNYMSSFYSLLPEERSIMATLHYLVGVNSSSAGAKAVNIYEFPVVFKTELERSESANANERANNYANTKAVLLLISTSSNAQQTVYTFYMDSSITISVADLLQSIEKQEAGQTPLIAHDLKYVFSQSSSKQTNTYTLTYGKNGAKSGCEAVLTFNEFNGSLNYTIKTFLGETNLLTNFSKSIYCYANGVVGVRALSTYNANAKNQTIVYEQLSEQFNQKLKLGIVANSASVLSMETMKHEQLATQNSSDNKGFVFYYNTQNDLEENTTTCIKYGGAN